MSRSPSGSRSSRAWSRFRRAILERDGWRCRECGRPGKLEVHHPRRIVDGGARWDPENCVTLCRSCHIGEHRERRDLGPKAAAWAGFVDEPVSRVRGKPLRN